MPSYLSPRRPSRNDQFFHVMSSIKYSASSFTSVCPWKLNKEPPLVRSNGSSVVHGGPVATPFTKHGSPAMTVPSGFSVLSDGRNVGSTIPNLSFSVRNVCWYTNPNLMLLI